MRIGPIRTFRSAAVAVGTVALFATAFVTPAAAYEPFPTNHLNTTFNPQAQARGGNLGIVIGDLSPTRYVVVTATNLTGVGATTLVFTDASWPITRTVLIADDESVVLDFGSTQNADGLGSFLVTLDPRTNATNLTLDVLSVGALINR